MDNKKILRELQLLQLQMLKEFDNICKRHNIKYMLFAGTALGAVRHRGFIPWDDDLDVVMLREEYEKFLEKATDELSEDYYLQKEFSEHWPMFFSKLRRNNTAYIERYVPKDFQTHQGVYIDIFPCDNLSDKRIIQRLQFFASKIIIAKALDRRGYLTNSKVKKFVMFCARIQPETLWRKICMLRSHTYTENVHVFLGASSKMAHSIFPRKWFEETMEMDFEDDKFPVSSYYDSLLTVLYGDYMTPTPEEDRPYKVHGEIIDLHTSYEKYVGIQKSMNFEIHTRSIR